jgi:hypothetical protein
VSFFNFLKVFTTEHQPQTTTLPSTDAFRMCKAFLHVVAMHPASVCQTSSAVKPNSSLAQKVDQGTTAFPELQLSALPT